MEMFFLKLIDGALGTLKNIFLYKNKNFISSLFNASAMFFYMTMISKLSKASDIGTIIMICIATFLGSYIPSLIMDKTQKEKVFVFDVISNTNENGKDFADIIRENNIPISTYKGYNDNLEQVLCSKIYSHSKAQSKMIEELIPNDFKYHVVEVKNYFE